MTDRKYIQARLDLGERLAQLAEEATELAHAALKLRRAYTGDNPTPVSTYDAFEQLLEEVADVVTCLDTLEIYGHQERHRVASMAETKMSRWATRLTEEAAKD